MLRTTVPGTTFLQSKSLVIVYNPNYVSVIENMLSTMFIEYHVIEHSLTTNSDVYAYAMSVIIM